MLAIFDPLALEHRYNDSHDWFAQDFSILPEVNIGLITLLSL